MKRTEKAFRVMCRLTCMMLAVMFFTYGCTNKEPEPESNAAVNTEKDEKQDINNEIDKDKANRDNASTDDKEDTVQPVNDRQPLYKRLCGKYSLKIDVDEYYTLEITEFGGNLYAFGGEAISEEEDENGEYCRAPYSFWAMEIFPEYEKALLSSELDECRAGIMSFSVMSNNGKYWSAPSVGTIKLTEGNIEFKDFDFNFPFLNYDSPMVFVPDEKVKDTFVYLPEGDGKTADEFIGLWREKNMTVPMYLEFTDDMLLRIYKKDVNGEVVFGCGGYRRFDDNKIECVANFLGDGTMPTELAFALKLEGEAMTVSFDDENNMPGLFGEENYIEFERIKEGTVPIITLYDVKKAGYDETYDYNGYK